MHARAFPVSAALRPRLRTAMKPALPKVRRRLPGWVQHWCFARHTSCNFQDMSTLSKLYELIDDLEMAMMTTRRADGHLRSRVMATQTAAPGADLWFVARQGLAIDALGPVLLFELAKGWLTGTESELGEMHHLDAPHRPTA